MSVKGELTWRMEWTLEDWSKQHHTLWGTWADVWDWRGVREHWCGIQMFMYLDSPYHSSIQMLMFFTWTKETKLVNLLFIPRSFLLKVRFGLGRSAQLHGLTSIANQHPSSPQRFPKVNSFLFFFFYKKKKKLWIYIDKR